MTSPKKLFLNVFLLLVYASLFWFTPEVNAAGKDYWEELGITRIGEKKAVKAPDFTLPVLNGKTVSLKDFRGKVVFLNFWATWCPPCKAEMPAMEAVYKKFKDKGLAVLAVNAGEDEKTVRKFINKNSYSFLILLDSDGSVTGNSYKAIGLPTTYLIDRNGMAVGKAEGAREWNSEESFHLFEELLKP